MNGRLTRAQIEQLLKPIKPARIMHANGQSHVPAYDTAAHLTRLFGFGGWDTEDCVYVCAFEDFDTRERTKDGVKTQYKVWTVGYTASIRLVIKDPDGNEVAHYENGAGGEAVNQPSRGDAHHLAMTTAISTALKRCAAFGMGDQFGLSLYNKGATGALVKATLVVPDADGAPASTPTDIEHGLLEPQSLGDDERQNEPGSEPEGDSDPQGHESGGSGGSKASPTTGTLTALHEEIRAHPKYKAMESGAKGLFLSNTVGHQVTSIRQLSDDDCEQALAALRSM